MDLYIVLGVARGASDRDIARAYRRLSRRYHPNINPGDREAAVRFAQIADAYQTLIDPDKRRHYDSGGTPRAAEVVESFGFSGFDFSGAVRGERATTFGDLFEEVLTRRARDQAANEPARGADLHARLSLSFDEAWRGSRWTIAVTRLDRCRGCGGAGAERVTEASCPTCEGHGVVRSVRNHMIFSKTCPACAGAGRLHQRACDICRGQGVEMRAETVAVDTPAGTRDGARLVVPGKGHVGLRGGAGGDLLVDIEVRPDERYRRDGDDVHLVMPIAVHDAALGARLPVDTPDGPATMRVPPGTQSGQRFRLRGRGAPSARGAARGDLIVEVRLMLPALLDERSKELLREFGRLNGRPESPADATRPSSITVPIVIGPEN